MELSKKVKTYNGTECIIKFEQADKCPICGGHIEPKFIDAHLDFDYNFSVFNFCRLCKTSFISRYSVSNVGGFQSNAFFINSVPISYEVRKFEEVIQNVSKRFANIYNQAKYAEELKLDEISGMGYRKALEILIKDYAITLNPDESAIITNTNFTLDQCIKKYIKNEKLQNLSKLTSWLGNDETHYTRKHVDKDIKDLKEYLEAVIYFVIFDLTADKTSSIVNP